MPRKKDDPQVSSSSSEYFTRSDKKAEGIKRQMAEEGVTDDLARFKLQVQVERGDDAEHAAKVIQEDEGEQPEEEEGKSEKTIGTKTLLQEIEEEVEDAKEKTTQDRLVKKEKKQRAIERKMAQEGEIQQEAG